MKTLIPLSDFVLEQEEILLQVYDNYESPEEMDIARLEFVVKVTNYTKFLKQPLTLGMFVPVDDEGNVLTPPAPNDLNGSFFKMQQSFHEEKAFEAAKEKVLFEGFSETTNEIDLAKYICQTKAFVVIEHLVNFKYPLTPSALKAIGIKE